MSVTTPSAAALVVASLIASTSVPLQAQNLRIFESNGQTETRAMVGLTIPLGGKSTRRNTQPRVDLRFDTSRIDGDPLVDQLRQRSLNPLLLDRRDVRATTVSLTFEANPKLMMNGQAFAALGSPMLSAQEEAEEAEKKKRGTGEKVARGFGWAGIGALAVIGVGTGVFLLSCGEGSGCFDEQ